jgi:hypothetical protein
MTHSPQRPGGITALCVLTIVLGSIGVLTGLTGIANIVFQRRVQGAIASLQPDEEMARAQQEMADEAEQFSQQHVVRNWIFEILRLAIAMSLLVGGIWSLGLKPLGRRTLLAVFAVGVVFEVAQIWPLLDARELTARGMDRMIQAQAQKQGNAPPGSDAFLKMLVQVMVTVQLFVMIALLLAKCSFYGFGLWYLNRPHVAALFIRPTNPDPQWA